MGFLKATDYNQVISATELNQILISNQNLDLVFQEKQAIQFVSSQISQRYRTDIIFKEYSVYSDSVQYSFDDRITYNGVSGTDGTMYYYNSSTSGSININPSDNTVWIAGDNRNLTLVKYILDIVIFNALKTCNYKVMQDLRTAAYNEAIAFFNLISEGKRNIDLPEVDAADQEGFMIRWGSDKPKTNNFYW